MTAQSQMDVILTAIAKVEAFRSGDIAARLVLHPVDMMDASCQIGALSGLVSFLIDATASAWGMDADEAFAILRERVVTAGDQG